MKYFMKGFTGLLDLKIQTEISVKVDSKRFANWQSCGAQSLCVPGPQRPSATGLFIYHFGVTFYAEMPAYAGFRDLIHYYAAG